MAYLFPFLPTSRDGWDSSLATILIATRNLRLLRTRTFWPLRQPMATLKQVDIRINAAKRLTKEMKSRRVDVETEKKRTENLIAQGEDKWTVGKQVLCPGGYPLIRQEEVVAEAQRMIPDAKQRLQSGLTDLKALLVYPPGDRAYYFRKPQNSRFQMRKERRPKMLSGTEKQLFKDEKFYKDLYLPCGRNRGKSNKYSFELRRYIGIQYCHGNECCSTYL